MIRALTDRQKLHALGAAFYHGIKWIPRAGDHYTTCRPDLELYRIAKIENGVIYTEYCTNPGVLTEWDESGFLTEGFGVKRVHVPEWVFGME